MKKKKSFLLFAAAAVLLLASTVGSTRAALTYYSEDYEMRIEVPGMGISLLENGNVISGRNYAGNGWTESGNGQLLEHMFSEKDERLIPGKSYDEQLCVTNSGGIDSYIRVIVYRKWTRDGELADVELSPDLIEMELEGTDWVMDEDASTPERTVLYYTKIVKPGETTSLFNSTLRIAPSVEEQMTETKTTQNGWTTVKTEFAYDGCRFNVKVEADAVQTHNAEDAIRSAWGVDVEVEEEVLKLIRGGTGSTKPAPEPDQSV